jgi:imidazolonepropionase
MTTLITNIRLLVNTRENNSLLRGKELSELPCMEDAYLIVDDGIISEYGKMQDLSAANRQLPTEEAAGATILPAWCDSHTHLVFAASREEEFVYKLKGMSYADIAAKGGGILNSAAKINAMSETELYDLSWTRLQEVIRMGTGAIEIKSGYGLSVEGELKMLRDLLRSAYLPAGIQERPPGIYRYDH